MSRFSDFLFKQQISLTARLIMPNLVNLRSFMRIRCKRMEILCSCHNKIQEPTQTHKLKSVFLLTLFHVQFTCTMSVLAGLYSKISYFSPDF